jgi:hypothetical protein
MQIQDAVGQMAADRGKVAGPQHLFLAVVDYPSPKPPYCSPTLASIPASCVQPRCAFSGAPPGTPAIRMPPLMPTGTLDRPALALDDLNPPAWQVLRWRQEHLPLQRLRRRSHYEALWHLESRAAWRASSRLGLDDDQRYSLSQHYLEHVERLAA